MKRKRENRECRAEQKKEKRTTRGKKVKLVDEGTMKRQHSKPEIETVSFATLNDKIHCRRHHHRHHHRHLFRHHIILLLLLLQTNDLTAIRWQPVGLRFECSIEIMSHTKINNSFRWLLPLRRSYTFTLPAK